MPSTSKKSPTSPTAFVVDVGRHGEWKIPPEKEVRLRKGGITIFWQAPAWVSKDRRSYLVHMFIEKRAKSVILIEDWYTIKDWGWENDDNDKIGNFFEVSFVKHTKALGSDHETMKTAQEFKDSNNNRFSIFNEEKPDQHHEYTLEDIS